MAQLALVMIVRDEEKSIGRCLESIYNLVDEIVVVDTGSTDKTKAIALSWNAQVFDFKWNNNFAEARNYALSKTSCTWSLFLDADEWVTNDCRAELKRFIKGDLRIGRIKIVSSFKSGAEVSYAVDYVSRLFPSYLRYEGSIHEQIASSLPREILNIECMHDGYYYGDRSERNIPLLKKALEQDTENSYLLYQLSKEYRGQHDFVTAYQYLKQSYSSGDENKSYFPNIIVDLTYSAIKCGKLLENIDIINFYRNKWMDFADMHFVCGLFYLELILEYTDRYLHLVPEIEKCYKACLAIGENGKYNGVVGTGSYLANHNLGVFYESTGRFEEAQHCYQRAADQNYQPSIDRLK